MSTAITMNDVSSSGVSCAADAGAVDVEVCGTGAGVVDADGDGVAVGAAAADVLVV